MMSPTIKHTDVFVPGGFPSHTYNPRLELKLEESVRQVLANLCKLVTVTGHTKSGKTVLVRSILPREEAIWVDGGGVGAEDDFWSIVIDQLNIFQSTQVAESSGASAKLSGKGSAGADFLIVKGTGEVAAELGNSRGTSASHTRVVSSRAAALAGLRSKRVPLVIDDFHYLSRDLQGEIVRALKPLVFDGVPVVVIAIPHRRYDTVKVEKEMTGRILAITIPVWTLEELKFIPRTGYTLLNAEMPDELTAALADQAIGSPHLMQEFCRSVCAATGITAPGEHRFVTIEEKELETVFENVAETIGRPIFEKLSRGPRQRTDRIPRKLKSGGDVDIYGLVLHALAHLRPGLVTLEYEDLRSAIRGVSADNLPQLHEVTRVLKHMSDIAATDQSSTPVIDFDEVDKRLHVTDPFFAFYLRWGSLDR